MQHIWRPHAEQANPPGSHSGKFHLFYVDAAAGSSASNESSHQTMHVRLGPPIHDKSTPQQPQCEPPPATILSSCILVH
eukprot:scaffold292302_cov21-Tisochrysis_lutea.AAC.1